MSIHDLIFEYDSEVIYDPLQLITNGTTKTIRVTNQGSEDLTNLGLFIRPATSVGDVDDPANFPVETDYHDLLTWGQASVLGSPDGGLKVIYPIAGTEYYISRTQGAQKSNKIFLGNLAKEGGPAHTIGATEFVEYIEFALSLEYPTGTGARRLFVDVVVE